MVVMRPSKDRVYCTECDEPNALRVRFQNPHIAQNGGFALCLKHAEQLGSQLLKRVFREQSRNTTE